MTMSDLNSTPSNAGARRLAWVALLGASALMATTVASTDIHAQTPHPSFFESMQARSIGPAGMSGRIGAIDAWQADPNLIYVGAATGGLWKSVNGGTTWDPVFDDQRVNGIGAVAINQANPDLVWVGTGEGNPRNSAGVGAGIYRSTDGGATWQFLGLENSERVHRIVLDPRDPDRAWAGVLGPAWSDGTERGVYRTDDGGVTWRQVLYVDERTGASDLVQDPRNPDHLIAGMWSFRRYPWFFESGGPGSGVYQTFDGGDTWTRLEVEDGMPEGDLGRIGLSFAPSNPSVVYALIEARQRGLHRSDDGGRTWEPVNISPSVNPRPFYYTDIFVDPSTELRLYNMHSRFQISEDGGKTFEGIESNVHSDFHALWINHDDPRHMILGSDGGVYWTVDRGKTWRQYDNLPVGQFYHVGYDMEIPFNVYGGMQDNGSWRGPSNVWTNGGIRNWMWYEVNFGDGFATIIDAEDANLGYAMSQGGNLRRFDLRTGERKDIRPWAPDTVDLRFNWNAAIAQDPFDPPTIYYGSQFVHRSPDRGDTWEIISHDLTTNDPEKQRQEESGGLSIDNTGAENHTSILTIAPSPVERGVIWVGSDDGRVHVARAGGGSGDWTDVTDELDDVPEGTWVPHVEADKFQAGAAFVVMEDHRRGNWEPFVFRTENYGEDFDRLVDEDDVWGFVHVIEQDPEVPELLYLGTEFGLWVSLDAGENWFKWTHGVPTAPVRALAVHPRDHDLIVATHGRAIFILDDVRPLRALARNPGLEQAGLRLVSPPPAYLVRRRAEDGYHFAGDDIFSGESRPLGALFSYVVGTDQATEEGDSVLVEIVDAEGRTVRSLSGPATPGLHRLSWDLREDPPEGSEGGGRFRARAPEVLPGDYTVRLSLSGAISEQPLAVFPDPRVEVPMDQRIAKREALDRALELNNRSRVLQEAVQEVNDNLGRLQGLLDDQPEARDALEEPVRAVRDELSGINDGFQELRGSSRAVFGLDGSRDAPTEAQRVALERMEQGILALERQVNGFIRGAVEDLRRAVEASGLEVFPPVEPIR
jgi:photosystem II stability/assembly factor-like uncharacterized protein